MNTGYFYLLLACSESAQELSVRLSLEEGVRNVFGECGAGSLLVDVLSVRDRRALVRVRANQLRKLRAALTLDSELRVLAQSVSLQALV